LVLKIGAWKQLANTAERLASEALDAEAEIMCERRLLDALGLPSALLRVLARACTLTPCLGRVMRFDFHPTPDGWRISEVNSDVPGGFSEATHFTAKMSEYFPALKPAGLPGDTWAEALTNAAPPNAVIALVSAPAYMEDHQVVAFLATKIRERGCQAHLIKPEQISWREGRAHLATARHQGPLDGIVRFYQGEWLARLPARTGWANFFCEGKTPIANGATSIITESKRFPLVWDKLSTKLATWRAFLPETCNVRHVPWARDNGWLLKTAYCNTGDTVSIRELMTPKQWLLTQIDAFLRPDNWIAQRRFESVPVSTPIGPRHVCLGVYTVNGKAAGAYARISEQPLIDFSATDVALLLEEDD
jgi:glutathionylspermidine synthase